MNAAAPPRLPLVVLPGMDGTGDLFRDFVERASRHRDVIVVDYPRDRPLGYDALADLAVARAPAAPYLVLGESFGGPLAIEVAARDPRVAGLVLVSTFARHPLPRWLEPPSRLIDVRRLPRIVIEGTLLGSDQTRGVRERLVAVLPTIDKATMRARTSAVLTIDRRAQLRGWRRPVLCIAARKDLLLGSRGVRDIRAARPDCTLELVDGPHMLLETRPADVAAIIERWARRVG